jgi:formylglycine-generating enzyme required for sulfatase activity
MKRFALALLLFAIGCNSQRAKHVEEKAPATATAPAAAQPPTFVNTAGGGPVCTPACNSIERCEGGKCVAHCPDGEVFIPATGPEGFAMGKGSRFSFDQAHRVVLTKPFCMDATEVTVRAYKKCVEAEKCTIPQLLDANSNYRPEFRRDDHPINMVNFQQAKNYCEIRGQALPTESQWEWAAGHGDGRKYPWGSTPEPTCENKTADFTPGGAPKVDPAGDVGCHGGGSSKVKSHPNGNSVWPDGVLYDMGGNLWEWTNDCYMPYPEGKVLDPSPQVNPKLQGDCYVRALRGGGWNRSKQALVTWWRAGSKRTYRVPGLGFRCVRNPS